MARFYHEVFGCQPVPPERDLSGSWLDDATGVQGVRIRGIHLRLPGYGEQGPTLEIFEHQPGVERPVSAPNWPGLRHLAFAVDHVGAARDVVVAAGGGTIGEVVTVPITGSGSVTFVYATDPEGNIVELQSWSPGSEQRGPSSSG